MAEEPSTDYEKALYLYDLDCSVYACWKPIAGFTVCGKFCQDHIHQYTGGQPINWCET